MQQEISNSVKVLYFFKCQNSQSRKILRAKFKSQHENQNNHLFLNPHCSFLFFYISMSYLKNSAPPAFCFNIFLMFTNIRSQPDLLFLLCFLFKISSVFCISNKTQHLFSILFLCYCVCVQVFVCRLVVVAVVARHGAASENTGEPSSMQIELISN